MNRIAFPWFSALLLTLVAACGGASDIDDPRSMPHQANADIDWRDQVIYQIMVDRFSNGDPNNDYGVAVSVPGRYHGGDWQGVIDRLDYLEELGVTALWISPTFANTEEDAGFHSYHGYWPSDFVRPNHHFGDLHKLRELVDKAHARGMLVILDVVLNHVGQLWYYDINGNGQADDWISGGGNNHTCVQVCGDAATSSECSPDEQVYCEKGAGQLEHILEWDPDYDPRGIQGWTSLGFRGPAEIRFTDWPELGRTVPPRPPEWFGWPDDKPWFDDPTWYNRRGRVYVWWHESDYSTEFVRQQETMGDFPGGLKDLDTDNPDVQEALIRIYQHWIDVADFDGFRIDTLKHMDRPELDHNVRGFIGEFSTRIRAHAAALGKQNFFIFGEAFDGDDELSGAYTFPGTDDQGSFGRVDSLFYFSQYYAVIRDVFIAGGPTQNIACSYGTRVGSASEQCSGSLPGPAYYGAPHATREEGGIGLAPQQAMVNFIDNHDLPRFLFEVARQNPDADGMSALRNVLFFLMTWDGIPCLYYGTEQAFSGGVDPGNRENMFDGNPNLGLPAFDTKNDTFTYVQELIALRKRHSALRRGGVMIRWATDRPRGAIDSGIFAFERADGDDRAIVVINTSDDQFSSTCAPDSGGCMITGFAPGTVLVDVAPGSDGATFTVAADQTLTVSVPPRGGRVLVTP
jgi:glycosidase